MDQDVRARLRMEIDISTETHGFASEDQARAALVEYIRATADRLEKSNDTSFVVKIRDSEDAELGFISFAMASGEIASLHEAGE